MSSNEELAEVAGFGGSAMRVIDSRLGDHISLEGQEIGEPGIGDLHTEKTFRNLNNSN